MKSIDDPTLNLDELPKVTKTYDNGEAVVFRAAPYADTHQVDLAEPLFLKNPSGKREAISYHKSGFVVSTTDTAASNGPVRRRSVWMLLYIVDDKKWATWRVESCSTISEGKRMIDEILRTGKLPA